MQLLASSDWIEASEALRMSCSDGSVSCNAQTRQRPVHAAWLVEPRAMSPAVYKEAQERALKGQLDLVFTHEWALVRRGGPFRYCPFGTTYLRRAHHRLYNKTALVSLIASRKGHPSQGGGMQGHSMRHAAIALLTPQRLVAGLYADGYPEARRGWQASKLAGLKDYMFSVVIENVREECWFTEKLVDALLTGTVPIYWGCQGIGAHFNMGGIIPFDDVHQLPAIIRSLSPAAYRDRRAAIEDNFRRARGLVDPLGWIWRHGLRDAVVRGGWAQGSQWPALGLWGR
mmetsp:Transcript_53675/g.142272  ORF Transcript_53675/g.142272 Transcript_53675/m.142272 type:complete len:286 (+) Transcript_53675:167-1024(+)